MALTVLIMIYGITIYLQVFQNKPSVYPDAGFMIATSITEAGLAVTAYKLYNSIAGRGRRISLSLALIAIFAAIAAIPCIVFLNAYLIADLRDTIIAIYFCAIQLLVLKNKKFLDTTIKKYYYVFLGFLALCVPGILLGIFLKSSPVFDKFPKAAAFLTGVFLIYNLTSLFYISQYFRTVRKRNADGKYGKYKLTKREIEIICLVKEGLTNPQIAERLFIAPHTVKNHLYSIFQKTGVSNRFELIKL